MIKSTKGNLSDRISRPFYTESEARIQQLEQQSFINEQLLSTVIADKSLIAVGTALKLKQAVKEEVASDGLRRINYSHMTRRQGRIVPIRPGTGGQYRVVTRTATVEGHSKAVLSVAATDELLLSGSKDRTAKLWDLQTGSEVRTLGVHPNNVHAVRFIPNSQLAISVSMYQIRVWDLRTQECVRMLQSSGQVNDGDGGPAGSRQNTVPFLETVVNAAEVDPNGKLLFTSFGGDVRIWNLDKWASFGRLVGAVNSPRSEVSCLAVSEGPDGLPRIFTGSRDHYVKMFQCSLGGRKSKKVIERVGSGLVLTHTDRPLLCSVCKEGTMKFWDITTSRRFKLVEELPKAHSESIYSVCSNKYMVFTAS
ncbi:WD domain, G-beta repeat protein, partial [Teladorsagia circumcincta]